MNNRFYSLVVAALFSLLSQYVSADVVLVVNSNSSVTSIALGDVRKLYLGKATSVPGSGEIKPINQALETSVRTEFDKTVLGKDPKQIKGYWAKRMFSGKGIPPKEVSSDTKVIETITANSDHIGYVDSASVTAAVKVVSVK